MFVSVVERQRESPPGRRGSSHSCLAKVLQIADFFGLVGPARFYARGMCVTWLHSRGNDRE